VRLSREKGTAFGAVFFGLLGAGVEAAGRASIDEEYEEKFITAMGDFDPAMLMNEKLIHYLNSQKVFSEIVAVDSDNYTGTDEKRLDGMLKVTIKEWGLRLCVGEGTGDQVQVGLNVHGKMVLIGGDKTVWERNELYLEGKCHPMGFFQSPEGVLKKTMTRAVDNLSGKIVNDILFP